MLIIMERRIKYTQQLPRLIRVLCTYMDVLGFGDAPACDEGLLFEVLLVDLRQAHRPDLLPLHVVLQGRVVNLPKIQTFTTADFIKKVL